MNAPQDPYEALGIPYGSSLHDIKTAWRAAARKHHPDASPENPEEAAKAFARAKEAYELLCSTLEEDDSQAPYAPEEPTEEPEENLDAPGPVHDPFARHAGPSRRGDDLRITVPIPLAVALHGGHVWAKLDYQVPCPKCAGTGAANCECQGLGVKRVEAHQQITIPANTPSGTRLRMPRRGGPGWGGSQPGDLDLTLKVAGDRLWQAEGRTLKARVAISTASGLMGVTLSLPHPNGSLKITVPSGTKEDYGVTIPGAGIQGDAHVTVAITPLDLKNPRVSAALRELDKAERGKT